MRVKLVVCHIWATHDSSHFSKARMLTRASSSSEVFVRIFVAQVWGFAICMSLLPGEVLALGVLDDHRTGATSDNLARISIDADQGGN